MDGNSKSTSRSGHYHRKLPTSSLNFAKYRWSPPLSVRNNFKKASATPLALAMPVDNDVSLPEVGRLRDAMTAVLAMLYIFSIWSVCFSEVFSLHDKAESYQADSMHFNGT